MDSERNFPFSDPFPFANRGQASVAGGGGPSLLPDGVYWQSGDASSLPPNTGQGWTSTSNLTNGFAGDVGSRETATGATISVLDVRTAFAIANWSVTARWKGSLTQNYYEWNGTSWTQLANMAPTVFDHAAYVDDTLPGAFSGTSSTKQHMIVFTEGDTSDGNMSVSDERPS
jgi:hypothetical protein